MNPLRWMFAKQISSPGVELTGVVENKAAMKKIKGANNRMMKWQRKVSFLVSWFRVFSRFPSYFLFVQFEKYLQILDRFISTRRVMRTGEERAAFVRTNKFKIKKILSNICTRQIWNPYWVQYNCQLNLMKYLNANIRWKRTINH